MPLCRITKQLFQLILCIPVTHKISKKSTFLTEPPKIFISFHTHPPPNETGQKIRQTALDCSDTELTI